MRERDSEREKRERERKRASERERESEGGEERDALGTVSPHRQLVRAFMDSDSNELLFLPLLLSPTPSGLLLSSFSSLRDHCQSDGIETERGAHLAKPGKTSAT